MKQTLTALTVLVASAFVLCQPTHAELQVYWKLDESSGSVAADSSGNGINGDWQGTVGGAGWVPEDGIAGGSVSFTGANVDSFITSEFTAVEGTPLTLSTWVKTESTANDGMVYLGNGESGNQYYVLRVQGGVGRANARNPAESSAAGSSINDGEWHHVLGVYADDLERRIYIDGVLQGEDTSEVPEFTLNRLGIGALARNTPYNPADLYEGQLDEVALWDRAFTDADAAALHGLGVLSGGDATALDPLMEAFDDEGSVEIDGRNWSYASGLDGEIGETGGGIATLNAFIVLDDSGNGMQISTAAGNPTVISYAAAPLTIFLGEETTLSWSIEVADTITIDQGIGEAATPSGTMQVSPEETTTYTLTATNGAGETKVAVTVTVIPDPLIQGFTATPAAVFAGEPVTLSWDVANFTELTIDQEVGTVTGAMGSIEVSPAETTTYTLTATNVQGSITAEALVTVFPPPPPRELLLHWALDEGSGTTAADSVGVNPGEFIEDGGTPTWTDGFLGGALEFPNSNDVSVRAVTTLVEDYPFAIAGWVSTVASENDTFATLSTGAFSNYYSLRVAGGNSLVTRRNGSFFDIGGPSVNDGEWHFIVGVFANASSRAIFVDGTLAGENEADSGEFGLPDRFAIGALDRTDDSIVDPFEGIVDDVSFWRGILTPEEIVSLYSGATELGLNAGDIGALLDGFEEKASASAAGLSWSYREGTAAVPPGTTSGSIAAGDAFIALDDSGNGMASQPADFSIISVVRSETDTTTTWRSSPGANTRSNTVMTLKTGRKLMIPSVPGQHIDVSRHGSRAVYRKGWLLPHPIGWLVFASSQR